MPFIAIVNLRTGETKGVWSGMDDVIDARAAIVRFANEANDGW